MVEAAFSFASRPPHTATDWAQVRDWDERCVFHVVTARSEYRSMPVASAAGCYVTYANGQRVLDKGLSALDKHCD